MSYFHKIHAIDRNKIGHDVIYDAREFGRFSANPIESFSVIICPKVYVDPLRNFFWRHMDTDLIDENLGIFDWNHPLFVAIFIYNPMFYFL